ncbi:hypothetical protein PI23P_09290 [Polaribacter irgensii 23-P]|uniref:Uncharacterized protein n=1 Tax=Polaribacter irgensii 23-P TaxID=313594 RepID=A4C067_9FLAO|nr:hypothetical protein PI23P_09290 [Polaribacter irgensii 23-P]
MEVRFYIKMYLRSSEKNVFPGFLKKNISENLSFII